MRGINKVILLGNVGRAAEVRYFGDGKAVASFSVATHRSRPGADGQREEETEWHRVAAFGRLGEVAGQLLDKGTPVYVEGRLVPKRWTAADGSPRSGVEVWADTLQLVGRSREVNVTPEAGVVLSGADSGSDGEAADIPF